MKIYPEATALFLKDRAADIRTEASRAGYRKVLRHFGNFAAGKQLHQIKRQDCIAYLTQPNERTGRPLAPNTIMTRKTILEAFFGWAHFGGHTVEAPMLGIENAVRARSKNVTIHRWLEADERRALLDACPKTIFGQRDKIVLMLGMFCGLRRSELAAVRWGDIQGTVIRGLGKGEKPFQVRMLGPVAEAVMDWRSEWVTSAGRFPTAADPVAPRSRMENMVRGDVVMEWGVPLGPSGVAELVVRAGLQIGVDLATHDLRRTFAGMLEEQNVPIEKISAALRHANIGTTQRYLAQNPRRTLDALDGVVIEL